MLVSGGLSVVSTLLPSVAHSAKPSSQSGVGGHIRIFGDATEVLAMEMARIQEDIRLICLFRGGRRRLSRLGTKEIA